jgi:hypothetical protein
MAYDSAVQICSRRGSGADHSRDVVKAFRYLCDPLFVAGCLAYGLNRFWLKPHLHSAFLHSYFNDLLLIPCALPPLLWLHRRLGLRRHDGAPTVMEVSGHLLVWSLLFEWIGPHWMPGKTGDPWDVAAYVIGGILAWLGWRGLHGLERSPRVVREL